MRILFVISLASVGLIFSGVRQANTYANTLPVGFPEYNGNNYTSGFPLPAVAVATESFTIPAHQHVVSANISGIFGETSEWDNSTAEFDLLWTEPRWAALTMYLPIPTTT